LPDAKIKVEGIMYKNMPTLIRLKLPGFVKLRYIYNKEYIMIKDCVMVTPRGLYLLSNSLKNKEQYDGYYYQDNLPLIQKVSIKKG